MTDAHWRRLAEIVPEALALPTAERDAFLDRACAAADGTPDPGLRAEAAALVAASDAADASGALVSPLAAVAYDDALPDRIGPWRVTGLLGEGGMGVVYRAERADGLFEREVALKRIRPGLGRALAHRLDAERHALARLEHDGIARLYDGGVSDEGVPYVVMELADGAPITDHARAAGLDTTARVRLFVEVCEAVAYAHQRLVVHRDLKPSNVFVTAGSEGKPPAVKLLDFGIAKILGDAPADPLGEALTRTHASMTPSYAAPEQLRGGEITTASDVYALGVMLYELLAEHRPYSLVGASPAEAERIVCEVEPPPPSSVAPADRARALRGDLDTVCLKALAKEPERRYASAEALAADLRRHLGGLPVEARPATAGYRARRFVRRHRVGVAATALVAGALVGGAGVALWQARVARAEAAKAGAVNEFLVGLLGAANPELDGRDVRVASLLDRAAANVDSTLAGQPDVAAEVHQTLGVTYRELGLYDEADRELRLALGAYERLLGPGHRETAEAQDALGVLLLLQDDLGPADSLFTLAIASARRLPDGAKLAITVLSDLAYVRFLTGDLDASLAMHREALALLEAAPEPDPVEVAVQLGNVAVVLENLGRADEAVPLNERQVALYRRTFEPGNVRIGRALSNLSTTYMSLGRFDDALRASTEAVAIFRRSVGNEGPELAGALTNLGPVLYALGRYRESEAVQREAMELFGRELGTDHPRYARALIKVGQAQERQGHVAAGEASIRRALGLLRANVPPDHPAVAPGLVALGRLLAGSGRDAAAEAPLREALGAQEAALPADSPDRAATASVLGDVLGRLGQRAEAESLLVAGHAVLRRELGPTDSLTAGAARRLAAYRSAGRRAGR